MRFTCVMNMTDRHARSYSVGRDAMPPPELPGNTPTHAHAQQRLYGAAMFALISLVEILHVQSYSYHSSVFASHRCHALVYTSVKDR